MWFNKYGVSMCAGKLFLEIVTLLVLLSLQNTLLGRESGGHYTVPDCDTVCDNLDSL